MRSGADVSDVVTGFYILMEEAASPFDGLFILTRLATGPRTSVR